MGVGLEAEGSGLGGVRFSSGFWMSGYPKPYRPNPKSSTLEAGGLGFKVSGSRSGSKISCPQHPTGLVV